MKLYHASFTAVDSFIPRVPPVRCEGEDGQIPRICFSDSLYLALRSMPSGGDAIKGAFELGFRPTLYVYQIDSDSIPQKSFMDYNEVAKYVPDAEYSHECWVQVPLDSSQYTCQKYIIMDAQLYQYSARGNTHYWARWVTCRKQSNARSNEVKFSELLSFTGQHRALKETVEDLFSGPLSVKQFLSHYGTGELSMLDEVLTRRKKPLPLYILTGGDE